MSETAHESDTYNAQRALRARYDRHPTYKPGIDEVKVRRPRGDEFVDQVLTTLGRMGLTNSDELIAERVNERRVQRAEETHELASRAVKATSDLLAQRWSGSDTEAFDPEVLSSVVDTPEFHAVLALAVDLGRERATIGGTSAVEEWVRHVQGDGDSDLNNLQFLAAEEQTGKHIRI